MAEQEDSHGFNSNNNNAISLIEGLIFSQWWSSHFEGEDPLPLPVINCMHREKKPVSKEKKKKMQSGN